MLVPMAARETATVGPGATRYRIVIRGRLSPRHVAPFAGMTLEHGPGQTALVGEVRDQTQLYGLLDRLRDLGLELVSVHQEARR
jgi:hypothetical protein